MSLDMLVFVLAKFEEVFLFQKCALVTIQSHEHIIKKIVCIYLFIY